MVRKNRLDKAVAAYWEIAAHSAKQTVFQVFGSKIDNDAYCV